MLRKLLLLPLVSSTVSAATFVSDFTTNNGGFSTLDNTSINDDNGEPTDELTFSSSGDQGGGVFINPAAALNSTTTPEGNITNTTVGSLFFNFTARTPAANTQTSDELGIFFGQPNLNASSSSINNGGNTNGFTFFFNDLGVFAREGNSNVELLTGVPDGQTVNFQVEYQVLASGQGLSLATASGIETITNTSANQTDFSSAYIVVVSTTNSDGTTSTSGPQLIAGATNLSEQQINNFTFNGISTRDDSGTITSFTVSDELIPTPIPEPSSAALLLLAGSSLLLRRKRG